ncbi:MAG: lactonase family protein [Acidobacteriaceae bacterium]
MMPRRTFLFTAPATLLSVRSVLARTTAHPSGRILIGTNTNGPGKGILSASWNSATGEIGPTVLSAEVASPTFLATHAQSQETFVYAVSEVSGTLAKVSAWSSVAGKTELKALNAQSTQGDGPTHVSVSPDGRSVFVANYGGGSVSSYHVLGDGSLSPAVSHFQFSGNGPNLARQGAPHTHSALPSPDGRFLLVNDLGLDRIFVYHIDSASAMLTPAEQPFWTARPGSGPRHLAWSHDRRFVYCSNELDSTVEVLAWDGQTGKLNSVTFISSLRDGFPPNTAFVGEITASTDGRNVYAGNRVADDTIAVFHADPRTGTLTQIQLAEVGGKNARHIALDPTGLWMVISHQESSDLTVVRRDPATGRLSKPVHTYPVEKPMCVVFV